MTHRINSRTRLTAENRPLAFAYAGQTTTFAYGQDSSEIVTRQNDHDIREVNGTQSLLARDHLASVMLLTDATGLAARTTAYAPYGDIAVESVLNAAVETESKGYIGERYDQDAGLQYLNARYYDPAIGLFVSPDWWEVTKPGVGTNRYMYSLGDPINASDPGGNEVLEDETVWSDEEKDALKEDFEQAREDLKEAIDIAEEILSDNKIDTREEREFAERLNEANGKGSISADKITVKEIKDFSSNAKEVHEDIGEYGDGVIVVKGTNPHNIAQAALNQKKGGMKIEINDAYFTKNSVGDVISTAGERTIVHEMGHASLGLSDRLSNTPRTIAAAGDPSVPDVLYATSGGKHVLDPATGQPIIYGYRADGLAIANDPSHPVPAFNDRFRCSLYDC